MSDPDMGDPRDREPGEPDSNDPDMKGPDMNGPGSNGPGGPGLSGGTEDPTAIRLAEFLPHPPALVWRALTDPELLARWFMPCDFKLKVGHRFQLVTHPRPNVRFGGVCHCQVLDFEPERMLRYTWTDPGQDNGLDSVVTWRLEPQGTGTRLFLDHEGFDPDNPYQRLAHRIMGDPSGWGGVTRRMAQILDEHAAAGPGH